MTRGPVLAALVPPFITLGSLTALPSSEQTSTIKTTHAILSASTIANPSEILPPLRNPPLLEATEDLTNLSYLNEPSGAFPPPFFLLRVVLTPWDYCSTPHYPSPILSAPNLHLQWNRPRRCQPFLGAFRLLAFHRASLRWPQERRSRASFVCHRRGSLQMYGWYFGGTWGESDHHRFWREVRLSRALAKRQPLTRLIFPVVPGKLSLPSTSCAILLPSTILQDPVEERLVLSCSRPPV